MSKVTVHVWHTPDGQIVAIGRPGKASSVKIIPLSERGHTVCATDVEGYTIEKLHETHVVDIQRGDLAPRDPESLPSD
jgi:hypothetical protein